MRTDMLQGFLCEKIKNRDTVCGLMLSTYLHLPIVLVLSPSKSFKVIFGQSSMVSAIESTIAMGMSDARMQRYSVNKVEVGVSCSACCVRSTL